MTTSRYKDLVIFLMAIGMVLLVIGHCNSNRQHSAQVTEYDNVVAELEADRLLILDSVGVLNEQLQIEREALPKRLNEYSKLPTKERIKLITKIDTLVVITDTSACLSITGVDSVNKLTIHYQSCMVQSAIKDSIITHLNNVVQSDSLIIASQQKSIKSHKKTAKIKLMKAVLWSGLAGVIIGLII